MPPHGPRGAPGRGHLAPPPDCKDISYLQAQDAPASPCRRAGKRPGVQRRGICPSAATLRFVRRGASWPSRLSPRLASNSLWKELRSDPGSLLTHEVGPSSRIDRFASCSMTAVYVISAGCCLRHCLPFRYANAPSIMVVVVILPFRPCDFALKINALLILRNGSLGVRITTPMSRALRCPGLAGGHAGVTCVVVRRTNLLMRPARGTTS